MRAEEDWSGLSDIVEINKFDPTWNQEVQSSHKEDQKGNNSPTTATAPKERLYPRYREKQKEYRTRFYAKINSNPVRKEYYKKKKTQWNTKWETNHLSKLTTEEREAYLTNKREKKRQWKIESKQKNGGFSSRKLHQLHQVRKRKAEGTATEEDLKLLHDYQAAERARRKKAKT